MSYIGNTVENQNYVPAVDYFNGDGSTTAFTLSRPVASVAAVQVVISNVPQNPGSAYTVSNNTITFTSAPPSGTANIYVYYTSPNTQVVQPGQGTVGTTQLATDLTLTNPTYTGTLTGGTGVVNIGSGQVYKDSSGNVGIGTSSPAHQLDVVNGARAKYVQILNNGYAGSAATTPELYSPASATLAIGAGGSERMRIDSSGNLLVGTTSASGLVTAIGATAAGYAGYFTGNYTTSNNANIMFWGRAGGAVAAAVRYKDTGTSMEFYSPTGHTVTYTTSSDYRLKENIQPMQGALAVVQQLNPVTYTWKADGSDGQGFIAHELQAVVPDCVTGEKDAVDEEGKPVYQGIDTSFLVATLTKAIQELEARVKQLEAK